MSTWVVASAAALTPPTRIARASASKTATLDSHATAADDDDYEGPAIDDDAPKPPPEEIEEDAARGDSARAYWSTSSTEGRSIQANVGVEFIGVRWS